MKRRIQALAALLPALLLAGCGGKTEQSAAPQSESAQSEAAPTAAPAEEGDWEATAQTPVSGQLAEGEVVEGDFWDEEVPAAGGDDFWEATAEHPVEEASVTLPGGALAPEGDFVFPASGSEALRYEELDAAFGGLSGGEQLTRSQLAINEIYARYGYNFHPEKSDTARYAYDYFNSLDWYVQISGGKSWSNTGEVPVNSTEADNIELLVRWQKDHGLR